MTNRILLRMGRVKNWARKARAKGYRVEYDDVWFHRNQGIFAFRLPSRQQVGELRPLDVIVCTNPVQFHQCKYQKKYFHAEERERLKALCKKYNAVPILCHRDNGLKFEAIS